MSAGLQTLQEQVRAARAAGQGLCIEGGGSKRFYGEAPQGELLSTRGLAGISAYEPSELVVTVRAGTPLAELEAALAEAGQCLAFEPPRFAEGGTVGGMVAAGLAGPSRAAVGGVRDFVLGATLLNGQGEVLSFGGQVMKNVAGYDVSRLLAGSLGILGLILEVSLKVLPLPPAQATIRFEMDQAAALAQLQRWGGQPLPINASAWWNGMLVLRLAGAAAAVQSAREKLGGELIEPATAAAFWQGLRDQRDEFFTSGLAAVHEQDEHAARLWRLAVPATAPVLVLTGEQLVEWGGAQRWLVSAAPPALVREAAARVGGAATVFRGHKAGGALPPLPAPLLRIHRQLKAAFDPERVFNRGRLLPEL
jgi:glycolate oxidase FAD binding subunit